MYTNSPTLSTRMFPLIPVQDFERNILFAQGLGRVSPLISAPTMKNMWCGHCGQLRCGTVLCFS